MKPSENISARPSPSAPSERSRLQAIITIKKLTDKCVDDNIRALGVCLSDSPLGTIWTIRDIANTAIMEFVEDEIRLEEESETVPARDDADLLKACIDNLLDRGLVNESHGDAYDEAMHAVGRGDEIEKPIPQGHIRCPQCGGRGLDFRHLRHDGSGPPSCEKCEGQGYVRQSFGGTQS